MKHREGYKGYVIEVRIHELKDGGFSAEFTLEEHDGSGVTETLFFMPEPFPTIFRKNGIFQWERARLIQWSGIRVVVAEQALRYDLR